MSKIYEIDRASIRRKGVKCIILMKDFFQNVSKYMTLSDVDGLAKAGIIARKIGEVCGKGGEVWERLANNIEDPSKVDDVALAIGEIIPHFDSILEENQEVFEITKETTSELHKLYTESEGLYYPPSKKQED